MMASRLTVRGTLLALREKGPSPAKLRRHEAEVKRIKKRIDKYVDGYIKALAKGHADAVRR
jgi:hypothetical protein